ncbi:MAG: CocE/NonD family hydrolase C-terminal non-catalytic domain-containing protein, partial [Xanthomonadales bacterium]|nr:CocE/NonD family hydrolase C-terminal non-catalytic domain-containing protein [Xanthomonadales bacterium]
AWPSPSIAEQTLYLDGNSCEFALGHQPASPATHSIVGLLRHGFESGEWGSFGSKGEFPPDQRGADGECLAFTSDPAVEAVAILGNPEVDLELSADRAQALVAVRLCDVAPDGASTLVSWGLLNLTHRNSHETPEPVEPGKRYQVTVPLRMSGYELAAGHRWRVGISPTFTRHAWPSPEPVQLSLFTGEGCRLRLPVRVPQPGDHTLPAFEPPEISSPLAVTHVRTPSRAHTVTHDHVDGWTTMTLESDEGRLRFEDHGLETDHRSVETFQVREGDPLSTRNQIRTTIEFQRKDEPGNWRVRVETESLMTADAAHFHVSNHMNAFEGEVQVFTQSWTRSIPRDLV